MCGPNAARGEDIVELRGKGAHLLRHGGNVVRQHAHPLHAHAQPAQLPRKEVSVRILEQIEKEARVDVDIFRKIRKKINGKKKGNKIIIIIYQQKRVSFPILNLPAMSYYESLERCLWGVQYYPSVP